MNRIHKVCSIIAVNSIWSSILAFCMLGLPILAVCVTKMQGMTVGAKGLGVLLLFGMPAGLILGVIVITVTGIYTKAYNHSRTILGGDDIDTSAAELVQDDSSRTEEIVCKTCGKFSPKTFDTCWNCQADLPLAKNVAEPLS